MAEELQYVAIQPYSRDPQFFTLAEWRMKDILENHYKTIEKHAEKLDIETVYSIGMANTDYVQIIRFKPQEAILFHEFMNDISKINAPFLQVKETIIGIGGMKEYPATFGVKKVEDEIHPDIREKFEKKGNMFVIKEEVTREDMKKEEQFLNEKGYAGKVYEYPLDKYGLKAFSRFIKPTKRRFAGQKRLMSVLYLSYTGGWWVLRDHERDQIKIEQEVLLKKFNKYIDRNT
ncbi:MAG: hypothetical protein E3J54_03950, partial [Actinobacteria bacterium]